MQLPHTVLRAANAWFQAANVATANYATLTAGGARLICAHGAQQHITDYAIPMLEGRYFGTMCLSEPQAGSSLADIASRVHTSRHGRTEASLVIPNEGFDAVRLASRPPDNPTAADGRAPRRRWPFKP